MATKKLIFPYGAETKVNGKTLAQRIFNRSTEAKQDHLFAQNEFQQLPNATLTDFHLENLINSFGEETVKAAVKKKFNLVNSKRKAV